MVRIWFQCSAGFHVLKFKPPLWGTKMVGTFSDYTKYRWDLWEALRMGQAPMTEYWWPHEKRERDPKRHRYSHIPCLLSCGAFYHTSGLCPKTRCTPLTWGPPESWAKISLSEGHPVCIIVSKKQNNTVLNTV